MRNTQQYLRIFCLLACVAGSWSCGLLLDASTGSEGDEGNTNVPVNNTPSGGDDNNTNTKDGNKSVGNGGGNTVNNSNNSNNSMANNNNAVTNPPSAMVTYSGQVASIVNTSCVPCHAGEQSPNLKNYALAKTSFMGAAKTRVFDSPDNPMPPAAGAFKLSASDKSTLTAWIAGGFLQ